MLLPYSFLARQLAGVIPALLTTLLFCASRWEITQTRIVDDVVVAPALELGVYWLGYRALAAKSLMNAVGAGFLMALGGYGYAGFRVTPLIVFGALSLKAGRLVLGW